MNFVTTKSSKHYHVSDMSQSLVLNEQVSAMWQELHLQFWSLFLA